MNSSIFYTLSLSFFHLLSWLSLCIVRSASCFVFVMLLLLQVILSHVTILSIGRASTRSIVFGVVTVAEIGTTEIKRCRIPSIHSVLSRHCRTDIL